VLKIIFGYSSRYSLTQVFMKLVTTVLLCSTDLGVVVPMN